MEKSYGLDVVERKKLSIGPHVLQDQMQVVDKATDKIYSEYIEFLDLKGEYGNADSLSVLGIQHLHGTKRIKRDFEKARKSFEKALKIDKKDLESNYYLGLMYMLGLGVQIDIPTALSHFETTIPKNDTRSINAIGYIYFKAPDIFEKDRALTNPYGSIRRDLKKAKQYFEKAAIKGNVNALYNMGCFHLTS